MKIKATTASKKVKVTAKAGKVTLGTSRALDFTAGQSKTVNLPLTKAGRKAIAVPKSVQIKLSAAVPTASRRAPPERSSSQMSFRRFFVAFLMLAAILVLPQSASALLHSTTKRLDDGTERITYRIGPLTVTPGQNRIAFKPLTGIEKPSVDGWITRIKPNMVNEDGSIPLSSKVMFHHGVWLNFSRRDATSGGQERFFATGEEKTITRFPDGYGYQYKASDVWLSIT